MDEIISGHIRKIKWHRLANKNETFKIITMSFNLIITFPSTYYITNPALINEILFCILTYMQTCLVLREYIKETVLHVFVPCSSGSHHNYLLKVGEGECGILDEGHNLQTNMLI